MDKAISHAIVVGLVIGFVLALLNPFTWGALGIYFTWIFFYPFEILLSWIFDGCGESCMLGIWVVGGLVIVAITTMFSICVAEIIKYVEQRKKKPAYRIPLVWIVIGLIILFSVLRFVVREWLFP